MFGIGLGEMVIFGIGVAVIIFRRRLPSVVSSLCKSVKEFKDGM